MDEFGPNAIVETDQAPGGKLFVLVVSPSLNSKTPAQRQSSVWQAIKANLDQGQEAQVSMAIGRGTDELW